MTEKTFGLYINRKSVIYNRTQNKLTYKVKLEFTTTACLRPKLLDKTYKTLKNTIVDVNLKTEGILYINIDPVPDNSKKTIDQVLEVARSYFNEVYHRVGEDGGNFSKAVSWALSQPKGGYFFNVEDDWLFDGRICIQEYINKINSDTRGLDILQCIATHEDSVRNRAYLPPSLFSNKVLQNILKKHPIPEDENPERWLAELKNSDTSYNVTFLGGVRCIDNGRAWMRRNNCKKSKDNTIVDRTGKLNKNFIRWDQDK